MLVNKLAGRLSRPTSCDGVRREACGARGKRSGCRPLSESATTWFSVTVAVYWATVCKTVRPTLSVRCLSFWGVGVLWPNSWMDQDETWHAGRPRPWPHCVRWGPSSPSPKGHSPPIFGPYLLRPNGCMDQDATRHRARPRPKRHCVRWGPRSPPQKGGPLFFIHLAVWPQRTWAENWRVIIVPLWGSWVPI